MQNIKNLLTAEQLSIILNISEFTVKRLAREQELPCIFINRRPRFCLGTVIKYLEKLEGGAA